MIAALTSVLSPTNQALDTLVFSETNHPLQKQILKRSEIADAIDAAAEKYDLDPLLILSCAWHESRILPAFLNYKRFGKIGEGGAMQTHGIAAKGCTRDIQGQFFCGARWLRKQIDFCGGDVARGISKYMTGYTCEPIFPAVRRINTYRKLKNGTM